MQEATEATRGAKTEKTDTPKDGNGLLESRTGPLKDILRVQTMEEKSDTTGRDNGHGTEDGIGLDGLISEAGAKKKSDTGNTSQNETDKKKGSQLKSLFDENKGLIAYSVASKISDGVQGIANKFGEAADMMLKAQPGGDSNQGGNMPFIPQMGGKSDKIPTKEEERSEEPKETPTPFKQFLEDPGNELSTMNRPQKDIVEAGQRTLQRSFSMPDMRKKTEEQVKMSGALPYKEV